MEFSHYILLTMAFVCVMLVVLRKSNKSNLPPGPKGLPVIGNLHQLRKPIQKTFAHLARKYGPVFSLRLGSVTAVVICSSDEAKEFFKTKDQVFASRPLTCAGNIMFYGYNDVGLAPYGPKWKEARKLCTFELLSVKRVQSFSSVRREEIQCMVDRLTNHIQGGGGADKAVNVTHILENVATSTLWRIICGRKFQDNEEVAKGITFRRLGTEIALVLTETCIGDFFPWLDLDWLDPQGIKARMKRINSYYDTFAENIVSERINRRRDAHDSLHVDDFLDVLLDQGCARQRIKALMLDLALGGIESNASTMEWVMSLVLKNPAVLLKVREEMDGVVGRGKKVEEEHLNKLKYLQCVVRETMRVYPPGPSGIPHCSIEDTTLCGYHVPKGTMLFLSIWAINRDPNVWEDPNQFKPERFMDQEEVDLHGHDIRSIPFGYGRRGCPGANMAISILMLTLATMLHSFRWRLPPGELDMEEAIGASLSRKKNLFAIPSLRK